MAIDVTTHPLLAVVQVDTTEVVEPDNPIELLESLFVPSLRAQVVTGRKGMACVDADAHTALVVDASNDACQVGEVVTEVGPLPCRILNHRHGGCGLRQSQVDALRNEVQTGFGRYLVEVRTRVEVDQRQTQLLGALHLVQEGGTALLQSLLRWVSEVDEITVMGQHMFRLDVGLLQGLLEGCNVLRVERFADPRLLAAGEERQGITTYSNGLCHSVFNTASGRCMCSNVFHSAQNAIIIKNFARKDNK